MGEETEGNMEMQFTFEDQKGDETAMERDIKHKMAEKMTPWEKYVNKKREKSKMKREERKLARAHENENGIDGAPFSDDELTHGSDIGQDTFFEQSRDRHKVSSKTNIIESEKGKKREKKKPKNIRKVDNDLSLLVMDSEDEKNHFDYKEIIKTESKGSKKLKKKMAKAKREAEENFKVDVNDERFSAVFSSADYNIDPSHPSFKKTHSMRSIVAEKQKRAVKKACN